MRWLTVFAVLMTFLGPLGTSAQDASPVPPEETVAPDPTIPSEEVTHEPTDVAETPIGEPESTATIVPTEAPDEETLFAASAGSLGIDIIQPGPLNPGDYVDFRVSQDDESALNGAASFSVSVPDGITLLSDVPSYLCSGGCTINSSNFSSSSASINYTKDGTASGEFTLILYGTVDSDVAPGSTLTITAHGTDRDGLSTGPANGIVTIAGGVEPGTLSVAVDPTDARPGDIVSVTAMQFDPGSSGSGRFVVPFPVGVSLQSGTSSVTCDPACAVTPTADLGGGGLAANYSPPTAGTTVTMTFDVRINPTFTGNSITFDALGELVDGSGVNGPSVVVQVEIPDPIILAITAADTTLAPGESTSITAVVYEPADPGTALAHVQIAIPAGLTFVSGTQGVSCNCEVEINPSPSQVSVTYGLVPDPNNTITITFDVIADPGITTDQTVTLTGNGTDSFGRVFTQDTATIDIDLPSADPVITMDIDAEEPVGPGDLIDITVNLDQTGYGFANSLIRVILPAGVTLQEGTAAVTCTPTACPQALFSPAQVTAAIPLSEAERRATLTLTVQVDADISSSVTSLSFNASATAQDGAVVSASPVMITVEVPDAEAALMLDVDANEPVHPQDLFDISVTLEQNGEGSGDSTITLPVPAGVLVLPGSMDISCIPACPGAEFQIVGFDMIATIPNSGSAGSAILSMTLAVAADLSPTVTEITFNASATAQDGDVLSATPVTIAAEVPEPEQTLVLEADATEARPGGDPVAITGTVQRPAAADETGSSTIVIDIPEGMEIGNEPVVGCSIPCDGEYSIGTDSVTGTFGSLTEASDVSLTIYLRVKGDVNPAVTPTIQLTASGTTVGGAALTADPLTLTILPKAAELDVDISPNVASPGETVDVTATFQMEVPVGSQDSTFEVEIPDGATLVDGSANLTCSCSGSVSGTPQLVTATITEAGSDGLVTVHFQATIDAGATIGDVLSFEASGVGSNGEEPDNADDTVDVAAPDPSISLALSQSSAAPDQLVTVTVVQVDPGGPNEGHLLASLQSTVAVEPGTTTIDCDPDCDSMSVNDSSVTVGRDYELPDDQPTTLTLVFQVRVNSEVAPGTIITFQARGIATDFSQISAPAARLTVVAPEPEASVSVTTDPTSAASGQEVAVNITQFDPGGDEGGGISSELPDGVTLVPDSFTINCDPYCDDMGAQLQDGSVIAEYSILDGTPVTVTLSYRVTIDQGVAPGTVISFGATAYPEANIQESIEATPAELTVVEAAPVTIALSADDTALAPGESTGVTVTINEPPSPGASEAHVQIAIPAGLSVVDGSTNASCSDCAGALDNTASEVTLDYQVGEQPDNTITITFDVITDADLVTNQTLSMIGTGTDSFGRVMDQVNGPIAVVVALHAEQYDTSVVAGEAVDGIVSGQVSGGMSPYSFVLDNVAAQGTAVVNNDGTFTYTANADASGSDQFTYTVTDSANPAVNATGVVNITISPPPLVTQFQSLNVVSGETITGDLAEGVSGGVPPYSFEVNQGPAVGQLTMNDDGTFEYTAPVGIGPTTTSFAYTVTDAQPQGQSEASAAASSGGEVQIIIAAAPLVTEPLDLNVDAGQSESGDLNPQVSGGVPPYRFAMVTNPTQGTATVNNDGTFTYTANPDAEGADQFTYTVSDSEVEVTSEASGAAASTIGVVNIIIAEEPTATTAPTVSATATSEPTEPIVTPTMTSEPGTPIATVTAKPGETPVSDPTKGNTVTKLPNTGQGGSTGGGSTAMLVALLMVGMVLLLSASRVRRR